MDERLAKLFQHTVDEYIRTGEPVGSSALVTRYRLDVSPATVRNWFAELDEEGLLTQAHTSGGRLPTERGFKLYIERFVAPRPASKREREVMGRVVETKDARSIKLLARTLSDLSGLAAFVGFRSRDTFYTGLSQLFGQPEFQNWQHVVSLSDVLDHLDEALEELGRERFTPPQIKLGSTCPFGPVCGTVLLSTPDGILGLLGPVRMDYQHALSLMLGAEEVLGPRNT